MHCSPAGLATDVEALGVGFGAMYSFDSTAGVIGTSIRPCRGFPAAGEASPVAIWRRQPVHPTVIKLVTEISFIFSNQTMQTPWLQILLHREDLCQLRSAPHCCTGHGTASASRLPKLRSLRAPVSQPGVPSPCRRRSLRLGGQLSQRIGARILLQPADHVRVIQHHSAAQNWQRHRRR